MYEGRKQVFLFPAIYNSFVVNYSMLIADPNYFLV